MTAADRAGIKGKESTELVCLRKAVSPQALPLVAKIQCLWRYVTQRQLWESKCHGEHEMARVTRFSKNVDMLKPRERTV